MFEIIKLLLPLIIQMLGDKKKSGQAADSLAAINCWRSPSGRAEFVAKLCAEGISQGRIRVDEVPTVIAALEDMADSSLMPIFVESLYALPEMAGE